VTKDREKLLLLVCNILVFPHPGYGVNLLINQAYTLGNPSASKVVPETTLTIRGIEDA